MVLDNEAVQALADPRHRKHRRVIAHLQVVADRKRSAARIAVVVPTSVRVEVGWDRTEPRWALANQVGITDVALDAAHSNVAVAIRLGLRERVSVVDAHVGSVVQLSAAERVTVISSDPADMKAVAGERAVVIVAL